MLKCVQQVKEAAEKLGATLDTDPVVISGGLTVDAPRGYVWCDNNGASMHEPATNFSQSWWGEAAKYMLERIAYGIRPCTPEEIESISYERDEDWSPIPAPSH